MKNDLVKIGIKDEKEAKIINEDKKLSRARLGLIYGSKIILSTGLTLLGISAPEKM